MSPAEIARRPPCTAPVYRQHRHAALWPILAARVLRAFPYRELRLAWTHDDYERACRELDEMLLCEVREMEEV